MTRVPAYWGKRQTTPKACPLQEKRVCFRVDDSLRNGYWSCPYYKSSSAPSKATGSVIVNCSAPTKKKEGKK